MSDQSQQEAILQVRDRARRRGICAFFCLHREQSQLLRIGNSSVSLNTSEDLTRLDVEVLEGRRQGAYTLMGDVDSPEAVEGALDVAVAAAAVAVPRDYDPIEPVVQETVAEQPQFDTALQRVDSAVKAGVYARVIGAVGSRFNYSGAWSSGSTELFLAGTGTDHTAWHLGTDQLFTCVLKHPECKWELSCQQTGWQLGAVAADSAVATFQQLLPVYAQPGYEVEPGKYTVLFGPQAIAQLLEMAVWTGFMGRGYEEQQGWTSGRQVGEHILSDQVTLVDDPADAATFRFGFDRAGLRRRRFPLVDGGRLAGIAYDLATAARYGREPTPHAGSWQLVLAPGTGPADPLQAVGGMGRVLYIPALHYMNVPNRSKGIFTGSSRFNAVLVEDGRIVRPIFSSRITDTFRTIFGNVVAMAPTSTSVNLSNTYGRRMPEAAHVPTYMVTTGVAVTDCASSF